MKNRVFSLCTLVLIAGLGAVFAQGCASRRDTGRAGLKAEVIESVDDQAFDAVLSTPTQFNVAPNEAGYSWERAQLFFSRYTSKSSLSASSSAGNARQVVISNIPGPEEHFRYSVTRSESPRGISFTVRCRPKDKSIGEFDAQQNARNLARFVKDGRLEVSLLKR